MQFPSAQEICIILLALTNHLCSGCCSACTRPAQGGSTSAAGHLTGMWLCCRDWCRGHRLALWLPGTLTAGIYTLGNGVSIAFKQQIWRKAGLVHPQTSVQESCLYFSSTYFYCCKAIPRRSVRCTRISSWEPDATYTKHYCTLGVGAVSTAERNSMKGLWQETWTAAQNAKICQTSWALIRETKISLG